MKAIQCYLEYKYFIIFDGLGGNFESSTVHELFIEKSVFKSKEYYDITMKLKWSKNSLPFVKIQKIKIWICSIYNPTLQVSPLHLRCQNNVVLMLDMQPIFFGWLNKENLVSKRQGNFEWKKHVT